MTILIWYWNPMIDGSLRLFHVGVASNKSFIFPQLKMLRETNNFFFRRTHAQKWTRIHFFGSYESSHDTNSIFLKAKNAQARTNSNCGKLNVSKKRQSHFLQTQTVHKRSFQKKCFSKKWGQALCACVGPPGPPSFFGEKHVDWKKTFVYRLRL